MNNIYYAKIWQFGAGFTNQISCLITSIILAYRYGKKIVIVDNFYSDFVIETSGVCISKIIDLDKINNYVSKKYGIIIFSRYDIDFKIKHVSYGYNNDLYDVTDKMINLFYKNNTLYVPKNLIMNTLNGDPCPNIKKRMMIEYSINDNNFTEMFNEILKEDIIFDVSLDAPFNLIFGWIDRLDRIMFYDILYNIQYNPIYNAMSENFIKSISNDTNTKINVLHVRLEHDAIKHWSKMNHMDEPSFKNYFENKYIELIRTHVDKSDENIILSYLTDNAVIDFLKNEGYKYHFFQKNNEGREINALIDLLIASKCNNVFIGNHHPQKLNGSTFSYYISIKLPTNVKQILIDVDHITHAPSLNF